jgi:hypothetical protein
MSKIRTMFEYSVTDSMKYMVLAKASRVTEYNAWDMSLTFFHPSDLDEPVAFLCDRVTMEEVEELAIEYLYLSTVNNELEF